LLSRATRYFPILEELSKHVGGNCRILEIGSGTLGIGEFARVPFVGCDISFTAKPKKPMLPVISSAMQLPFATGSFDVVIASDVMEHVPPEQREKLIAEALRVARKGAVFGFPCGRDAFLLDQKLFSDYQRRGMPPPIWLEEHMQHPFPDRDLFRTAPNGWQLATRANESLRFHYWLMRREMWRPWRYAFRLALLLVPGVVRRVLRGFDEEPSYRTIYTLVRQG
jgi:SAM-dependent methyltransferase